MVTCPRCTKLVDETTTANCPHCFTPLAGAGLPGGAPSPGQAPPAQPYPGAPGAQPAPQSYAPQLSRSGGTRVSLTGEVIDDNAGSVPPPSYVGGGAPLRPPVGAVPPRPGGSTAARGAYSPSRSEAPAKSGAGGMIAAILIGLIVLGGVGGGAWWFLTPHIPPKTIVQQFDKAIAAQDWKTVYTLIILPPDTKSKYADAAAFAADMTNEMDKVRANPMFAGAVDAAFKSYETAQVGEATIDGDSATVPVTLKMSIPVMGTIVEKSFDQKIPLRKVSGGWKIDGLKSAMPGGMGPGGM